MLCITIIVALIRRAGSSAAPCTSTRNLLAHAPDRLHEEVLADYNDMIYAKTKQEIEAKRKVFIRK